MVHYADDSTDCNVGTRLDLLTEKKTVHVNYKKVMTGSVNKLPLNVTKRFSILFSNIKKMNLCLSFNYNAFFQIEIYYKPNFQPTCIRVIIKANWKKHIATIYIQIVAIYPFSVCLENDPSIGGSKARLIINFTLEERIIIISTMNLPTCVLHYLKNLSLKLYRQKKTLLISQSKFVEVVIDNHLQFSDHNYQVC